MFLKAQLSWNVIIPAESLDVKGLMLQKSIITRLLDDFSTKKATKDLGYFLAVTTLDNIGEGRVRQHTGDVLFPVLFSCITFKPYRGEILVGVVHKILKHGVFLRCGPIENIYLSNQKMSDYKYVPGENPIFMSDKMSKIEKDVVVRFIVIGTKYIETDREFQAVVSLEVEGTTRRLIQNLKYFPSISKQGLGCIRNMTLLQLTAMRYVNSRLHSLVSLCS